MFMTDDTLLVELKLNTLWDIKYNKLDNLNLLFKIIRLVEYVVD